MRFSLAVIALVVLVASIAFTASCPTPCTPTSGTPFGCGGGPGPNPNPAPDTGCATQSQAIAIRLAGEISFTADHGGTTCVPTSTKCGDAASCSVNVGDVAIGTDEVVKVTIGNFGQGSIDVSGVSVEATAPDWYVEGQPPSVIGPNTNETVSLVLRPSAVGNCDGNLVVTSDAINPPRGNVALTLHANCVAGGTTGCSIAGACCCANGATSGDPICDGTGRVSCGTGFIGFDDACNEAPCTP